ncbi:MAG: alpha-amylase family glycosyl hydrolase [Planctomycetota bacterium]
MMPSHPQSTPIEQAHRHFGPQVDSEGISFSLWAPNHEQIDLVPSWDGEYPLELPPSINMQSMGKGYWHGRLDWPKQTKSNNIPLVKFRYRYAIGEALLYDPASRFQPDGVHGPSALGVTSTAETKPNPSNPTFLAPGKQDWIIYELHVGAFTDHGTYAAAIDRLDELVDLGISAIELMPLAECPGRWNWGYDGVCWFAPMHSCGSPNELKLLIDEAHSRGLMVIHDVVYNHFGPEGNYLRSFGPYLSAKHQTAWGAAPNFDDPNHGPAVRRWVIANALMWLDEYGFDALRVDAIHCMRDESPIHVIEELAKAIDRYNQQNGTRRYLIAESNVYDSKMTKSLVDSGFGFDAQWSDCFLHSMFAVVRPEEQLSSRTYYPDRDLKQVVEHGYVYSGSIHQHRQRDETTSRVDTSGLIYCIQNHDFIGNHPTGKRLHQIASTDCQRAAAAMMMMLPPIPMLFMGEEFCSPNAFSFFVDFSDAEIRQGVVDGRRREYPQHDWSKGISPLDKAAFESSKIGPLEQGDASMRSWYQELIKIRRRGVKEGWLCDERLSVLSTAWPGFYRWRYQAGDSSFVEVLIRLAEACEAPTGAENKVLNFELPPIAKIDWFADSDNTTHAIEPIQENSARIIGYRVQ